MKKILSLLPLYLAFLQAIHTQTVERSLSKGYHTMNALIKPYGTEKWLIAGLGTPALGAYFQDTLFVTIIGNDGQIYLRKNLSIPIEEVHYHHDLVALPDGGILVCFESTLCDVGGLLISVQRLDAQGNLMWEKTNGFVFGENRPPEKWFVAPDGNLLGAAYNQIWKVNTISGDIIWKAPLEGVDGGTLNPFEFELLPGTEDFFAMGNPDFQLWKQSGDPLAPSYEIEKQLETPSYYRYLGLAPNNQFYCWQVFPSDKIVRLDLDFQLDTLPIQMIDYGNVDIAFGNEGLYLTESNPYDRRFRRFDMNGENPLDLLPSQNWLSPKAISCHAGMVAVVGEDLSGNPNSIHSNSGGWLRIVAESNPLSPSLTPDAAVIEVKQNQPVDTSSFPAIIFGVWYDLQGGDFKLKIKNEGALPLNSICLNVTFGYNEYFDICPSKPSRQKQFANLNLAPGESTWLDFGDIEAQGQAQVPTEICFWTSSPNEQPDAVHENDRFCHPVTYIVAAHEPDSDAFSFRPNPADLVANLFFQEDLAGEPWQLFDALGRLMAAGVCPSGNTLRLETGQLPNGFYLFQVKNRVGKLVVQH